ncbi:MAG: ADP-ribosylglycohydrolase family protein [Deltaproteobacteria bacterium]|nr:ADP-ribosylglycohydrolase family protein [Deltaproteobacteria bacterium]
MKENRKALVLGSFLGDSMALGVHWIYEVDRIRREFGRVENLLKPFKGSYHPSRDAGEFTHYGDQAFVLLASVASLGRFDLQDFAMRWRKLFENYDGYVDRATRQTLANFAAGKDPGRTGSSSSDLAGAARIAPLVAFHGDDLETMIAAVRAQTSMTHSHPAVLQEAEFFARTTRLVLEGETPVEAMKRECADHFQGTPLAEAVGRGLESTGLETVKAVLNFGQSCDERGAFPAVVHLIGRYETNFREALVENVMAGGDSAARGMLAGMVLGAHLGMGALPGSWLDALKKKDAILSLLER